MNGALQKHKTSILFLNANGPRFMIIYLTMIQSYDGFGKNDLPPLFEITIVTQPPQSQDCNSVLGNWLTFLMVVITIGHVNCNLQPSQTAFNKQSQLGE